MHLRGKAKVRRFSKLFNQHELNAAVQKPGEKKGAEKLGNSSYVIKNKRCKNVGFGVFHDVYDNTGAYTALSTMSMKINGMFEMGDSEVMAKYRLSGGL
jgi:hypothetical protein